jgi:alpha-1,3-rhamnosyl/mannosyltransferase
VSASDPPLGIVLGTDTLLGTRSGIGRVTLEIFRALHGHAEIADLRVLVQGKFEPSSHWAHLLDESLSPPPPRMRPLSQRFRAQLARIPLVHELHLRKHRLAESRAARRERRRLETNFVYHEPSMIAHPFDGATVVTVNDLSFRWRSTIHPPERIRWIERNLPRTLRQATRFVAISEFTAGAMGAEFGIPRARIDVVPLAPSPAFRPMTREEAAPILARHGLEDRGYVLSVSTLEPRKNFDRLVLAHGLLPPALRRRFPLVIAGGRGWGTVLDGPAAKAALADGALRLPGHLPDDELVALCARSAVFAYVSLYEGFGLPVVEAMAAGAPVVASATTATGETAGEAALTVDPLDEAAIAEALRRFLEDPALADRYRALGLAHARQFTWAGTVSKLIESWRRARIG